jgi:hypothetical protein
MKLGAQMTPAEKAAFKSRPDVQAEYQQFSQYFRMLRQEIDEQYERQATTEDYYCYLRTALGFDHPSISDHRAPALRIIRPYLLEEIDVICKKPRFVSVNGHLVRPEAIPDLNNSNNANNANNFMNYSTNNGYWTNNQHAGFSKKRHTRRRKSKCTRRNNRR